jgi:hypothetical protein
MNRILETRVLAPEVTYFRIEAPKVARKRQAGQFGLPRFLARADFIGFFFHTGQKHFQFIF